MIARNSSFVYKDRLVDVRQVGRELGVRYVLEGSVRKSGHRVRITGQLIEAETGTHLWADRYDGILDEVFDLQDRITASVVGVVEPNLRRAEIERARRKRPDNLGAYDLYLRALPLCASAMPEDAGLAIGLLEQALKLDANYAAAHAWLAWCLEARLTRGGFVATDRTEGVRHARLALTHGGDDPTALSHAAPVILHLDHDFVTASSAIERALALNSSCAAAFFTGAHIHAFSGDPAIAEDYANRAFRLSPFDPQLFHGYESLGCVRLRAKRYEEAASFFARAAQTNPRFSFLHAYLAGALAMAGRTEDSEVAARRLLELEPDFRVQPIIATLGGFPRPELTNELVAGWRKAGLPE